MPCPTCGHTMHSLGCKVTDDTFYWCPRCGTIKPCDDSPAVAPALVERCLEFSKRVAVTIVGQAWMSEWERLGIAESINVPEDRKPLE